MRRYMPPKEEAIARYGGRFASQSFVMEGKELGFEDLIAHLATDGRLLVNNNTVLATIYWEV
ncbi:hypothetical protein [Candidatus Oscillochloris fontis]|uniref:hypothetical protein n=1 Tax=Candidatus Oscillochloris fontis TaxID=2496868 RepID=UPI00101D084B|nr:hypothetical protein [Candidatus Oscillochloris fontis]